MIFWYFIFPSLFPFFLHWFDILIQDYFSYSSQLSTFFDKKSNKDDFIFQRWESTQPPICASGSKWWRNTQCRTAVFGRSTVCFECWLAGTTSSRCGKWSNWTGYGWGGGTYIFAYASLFAYVCLFFYSFFSLSFFCSFSLSLYLLTFSYLSIALYLSLYLWSLFSI